MLLMNDSPRDDTSLGARRAADRWMHERYQRTRDPRHRDELIERYMPLAHHLARRYQRGSDNFEDIAQVAAVWLINAVDRFDPARGMVFSSFAVPTISGEIKRYFRDRTWAIRPPRALQENVLRLERTIEQFTTDHGRPPTIKDLMARLDGLDEEHILEALQVRRAASTTSLDASVASRDGSDFALGDSIGSTDDGFDQAEQRTLLEGLMRYVSPREREILRMRFAQDMTQAEIGEIVGVSQMQVSRILRGSIARMSVLAQQPPAPSEAESCAGPA